MAQQGPRSVRTSGRAYGAEAADAFGQSSDTRHPLVALAMVLPFAVLLAVLFGGWDAVVTQASSVVGLLGR
ncbi:hypothetical protein [Streptomyces orinoci]|uniref:Uncharacterized protein n=1 Tax=Streptomyces orinoci TaxID=67339 RepID=A0ABV3JW75_STRON|nr:hypothetical protein [Streptomyces orinoci]